MKKILVVLLSLLVVGAVFGNVVETSTDIPVNVTVLTHFEMALAPEQDGTFDFTFDPQDLSRDEGEDLTGIYSDTLLFNVKANNVYTFTAEYFDNTSEEYDLTVTPTFAYTSAKIAGNNTDSVTMSLDPTNIPTEWWSLLADDYNVGTVTVTVAQP
jgi:hypothetical protein